MRFIWIWLLIISSHSFAKEDNLLKLLPEHIFEAFFESVPQGAPTISTELRTPFNLIQMPEGMVYVGSYYRHPHSNQAAYLVLENIDTVITSLSVELQQAGFLPTSTSRWGRGGGFSLQSQEPRESLCSEEYGYLSFQLRSANNNHYLVFHNSESECPEPGQTDRRYGSDIMGYLPRLQVIGDATEFNGGGTGGGSDSARAAARFKSKSAPVIVSNHFPPQLQGQGWTMETSWQASVAEGSLWNKKTAKGKELKGILSLARVTDDLYFVTFNIFKVE